jgi:hypothetical protein
MRQFIIAVGLYCMLHLAALGREQVFRRDGDGSGEFLKIEGDRYEIESWHMDGRRTKVEGLAIQDDRSVTLVQKGTKGTQPFSKHTVDGVLYLVRASDEKRFAEAKEEPDWYIRSIALGSFFHKMPLRQKTEKANQSSQRNAMARPISVFESRSSRG